MTGADNQLADALAATLRAVEPNVPGAHAAFHRRLGEGGWWDFFDFGLSAGEDIEVGEALLAAENFGRFLVPPDILAVAGFLVPLLNRLAVHGAPARSWRERLDEGPGMYVARVPFGAPLRGSSADGRVLLSGSVERALCANASCALVPVQLGQDAAFALVDLDQPGVSLSCRDIVVAGHQAGSLSFVNVEIMAADLAPDLGGEALRRASDVFSLLLDAHAVGMAAECLQRSVEFTSTRRQFDQPVGAFQAVQHMAAEIHVRVETSRSAVQAAATALVEGGPDAPNLVAASRLHCAASAQDAAEIAIQMHGGAGFTWEFGLHHFYRAAMFARHYLTNEHDLRRQLAASIRERARAQIGERDAA